MVAEVAVLDFNPTNNISWIADTLVGLPDPRGGRVVLFDSRGDEQGAVGREGEGPGELGWPVRIFGTADGGLLVAGSHPPRVTFFSLRDVADVAVFPKVPGMPLRILGGNRDEVRIAWVGFMPGQGSAVGTLRAGEDEAEESFVIRAGRDASPSEFRMPAIVAEPSGALLVGSGSTYTFRRLDRNGGTIDTFGLHLTPTLPTDDQVERERRRLEQVQLTADLPANATKEAIATFQREPVPFFTSTGLAVDEASRLWVITSLPAGDSTRIDLFPPDGKVVQLRVRDRALALAVRRNRIAVLVERQMGSLSGLKGIDVYVVNDDQLPW